MVALYSLEALFEYVAKKVVQVVIYRLIYC